MNIPPIEFMRKEAKRMKKQSNGEFTHGECLDVVAAKYGFRDWQILKMYHPERADWLRRHIHTLRLEAGTK